MRKLIPVVVLLAVLALVAFAAVGCGLSAQGPPAKVLTLATGSDIHTAMTDVDAQIVYAGQFSDSHWAYDAVQKLVVDNAIESAIAATKSRGTMVASVSTPQARGEVAQTYSQIPAKIGWECGAGYLVAIGVNNVNPPVHQVMQV